MDNKYAELTTMKTYLAGKSVDQTTNWLAIAIAVGVGLLVVGGVVFFIVRRKRRG